MWIILVIAFLILVLPNTGFLLDDKLEELLYVKDNNSKRNNSKNSNDEINDSSQDEFNDNNENELNKRKSNDNSKEVNKSKRKSTGRKSAKDIAKNLSATETADDDLDDELVPVGGKPKSEPMDPKLRTIMGLDDLIGDDDSVDDLAEKGLDYALGGGKRE